MRNRIIAAIALLSMSACATPPYEPVVDTAFSQPAPGHTYAGDLTDCRLLADRRDARASAAKGAVAGAMLGGALGLLLCAGTGDAGTCGLVGAGAASTTGALSGGASEEGNRRSIVQNCMMNRGWNVVGE